MLNIYGLYVNYNEEKKKIKYIIYMVKIKIKYLVKNIY